MSIHKSPTPIIKIREVIKKKLPLTHEQERSQELY